MIPTIRNTITGALAVIAIDGLGFDCCADWPAQQVRIEPLIFGQGNQSCGEFLQAADDERKTKPSNPVPHALYTMSYAAFFNYTEGFLSGANWGAAMQQDIKHETVGSGIHDYFSGTMVWLENYCRQHPLENYGSAVFNLTTTLAR